MRTRFSALVLAGGRSIRLGGAPKALLYAPLAAPTGTAPSGSGTPVPLVRRVVDAVIDVGAAPGAVVVVGPEGLASLLPAPVRIVQEEPRFAGPAAAIAAGAHALANAARRPGAWTFVLSCDLAEPRAAVAALLSGFGEPDGADVVAARTDRVQHLVSLVRTEALLAATEAGPSAFVDALVRALAAAWRVRAVEVPDSAIRDVDTWDDVRREGLLVWGADGFVPAAPGGPEAG